MIRRAIVPVAVLAVAGLGLALVPAVADAAKRSGPCCATCCRRQQLGRHRRRRRPAHVQARSRASTSSPTSTSGWPRSSPTRTRLGYFLAIRQQIGEGHDQFVDDMFTLPRRPAPVRLAAELRRRRRDRPAHAEDRLALPGGRATAPTTWRSRPTARRLLVSASTAERRRRARHADRARSSARFPSGDQPHENNFSKDGSAIYHASIGRVYTPLDDPPFDATQGRARLRDRRREHARRSLKKIDMGQKLAEAGYAGHELRGPADGALARRALRLLPGLVLPRLRRVRPRSRTRSRGVANLPLSDEGRRRCRASSTCSTPPTTASR